VHFTHDDQHLMVIMISETEQQLRRSWCLQHNLHICC